MIHVNYHIEIINIIKYLEINNIVIIRTYVLFDPKFSS